MLFNSYIFIFIFLPICLLGFYQIGKRSGDREAITWLVAASLFFYGWWNPAYLGLIIGSMLFNYAVGVSLSSRPNRLILAGGVGANLFALGYFKYTNFILDSVSAVTNFQFGVDRIILPLAISFFTFQQIAYLVDAYRNEDHEYKFIHYALFVTFFPQLIAGPIVHHKDMLPQFTKKTIYRVRVEHLAVGLTIFAIGLFKKTVLADGAAGYVSPVFSAAEAGVVLTFIEAWGASLAYTFQIYFDFSGYSDMAIGLAWMFSVRLPLNFSSPYKATSILDFWRRWHITLSRFLRDYLYIPLGGNRKGESRYITNVMITMLLGGLWHGAGWTFVLWGGLHGIYLVVNHVWRRMISGKSKAYEFGRFGKFLAWSITFLAVVIAWVPFRADSMVGATGILSAMAGENGFVLPISYLGYLNHLPTLDNFFAQLGGQFRQLEYFWGVGQLASLFILLFIAIALPNTQEFMRNYQSTIEPSKNEELKTRRAWLEWQPTFVYSALISLLFAAGILSLSTVSEFLYFRF